MRVRIFIEGMIFSVMGLLGLYEGIRLARVRASQSTVIQDSLGSDGYMIMIGLALIIVGVSHIIINYKKNIDTGKKMVSKDHKDTLIVIFDIFVSLIVYVLLMNYIGYLVGSLIFFLLILKIFKFKWSLNVILSVFFSIIFYMLFGYVLKMPFPKGMLF
jgi:hypothetical protein